jgi:hypothetical protein
LYGLTFAFCLTGFLSQFGRERKTCDPTRSSAGLKSH